MVTLEIVGAVALIAGVPVVVALAIARLSGDGPTLVDILGVPGDPWPRGVQEEEPRAWRFDALTFPHRPRATVPSDAARAQRTGQVVDGIRPTASM